MPKKLIVKAKCVKDFLSLFDSDEYVKDLILGDTWYPSSGLIDESILDGKRTVREILDFEYDFDGLIEFEADIGEAKVKLLAYSNQTNSLEEYEVFGTNKDLYDLYSRAIIANEYYPNKYQLHLINEWD